MPARKWAPLICIALCVVSLAGCPKPRPELNVNTALITLSPNAPSVNISVANAGGGTLRWSAQLNVSTGITAAPWAFSGNSGSIALEATDFTYSYDADLKITNTDDSTDAVDIPIRVESAIQLANVVSGTFVMGHRTDEPTPDDALPRHNVTLSDYRIGVYEITNGQFADVLNWANAQGHLQNDSRGPYTGGGVYFNEHRLIYCSLPEHECALVYQNGRFIVEDHESRSMENFPVGSVTWYGAVMFCNWLSEKNGLTPCYSLNEPWQLISPIPNGYRLPTEAEWERAAAWDAASSKHWIYPDTSDTYDKHHMNFDTANPLGFTANPLSTPVGYYNGINPDTYLSVSPVGCYDMAGNVMEWCYDRYGLYASADVTDPIGPYYGQYRVIRGGGWCEDEFSMPSAARTYLAPEYHSSCVGLRVAINGVE